MKVRITPEDEAAMAASGVTREQFIAEREKELCEKQRRSALRRGGYGEAEAAARVDALIAAKVFPVTMRYFAIRQARTDLLGFEEWASNRIGR